MIHLFLQLGLQILCFIRALSPTSSSNWEVAKLTTELHSQGLVRPTPQLDLYYKDLTNMFYIREKEYLAKGTNLDVNRSIVVKWYDKVRTPIETSYKLIKSFLIFTSSRSWLFRLFIFVLAMLIYTLYLLLKGTTSKEDFRLLLTILLLQDNIIILQEYLVKLFYPLFNSLELFSG